MDYVEYSLYAGYLQNLADYYKYHNEIPRFFAKKLFEMFFEYHDEKRKLNFRLVTKMLNLDQKDLH